MHIARVFVGEEAHKMSCKLMQRYLAGVPKETVDGEARVALAPAGAAALLKAGFKAVCVEGDAGAAAQFTVCP